MTVPSSHCLISVAMSVGTGQMIAIPFAIIVSPVAMILRKDLNLSCNQFAYAMPMIAIPRSDDCRSLHVPVAIPPRSRI